MSEIALTINGQTVSGNEGDTLLDVCRGNGIHVPTLCHLKGLSNVGACRMCEVEVEGERRTVPACAYPARSGLVVRTHTPQIEKHRRLMLELLFAERNHFCMFCQQSGDCELQSLAYEYQMDHVRYRHSYRILPTDGLNPYMVIDHNRCVLCGRCVRACAEVAGARTLDFANRGWKTLVVADLEQSLGESSCISCGACLQACPTGAIFSKLDSYKGKSDECEQTTTVCPVCGVGCQLNIFTRHNNVVRIEAPTMDSSKSSLCKYGRFRLLAEAGQRVTTPMLRNDRTGRLEPCTLEEATSVVAARLSRVGGMAFGGLISSRYPLEVLSAFQRFMVQVIGSRHVDTTDGKVNRILRDANESHGDRQNVLPYEAALDDILDSDCVIIADANPVKTHPVLGSLILRATNGDGAKLIVIGSSSDVFPASSDVRLKPRTGTSGYLLEGLTSALQQNALGLLGTGLSVIPQVLVEASEANGVSAVDLTRAAMMISEARQVVVIHAEGSALGGDVRLARSLRDLAAAADDGDKRRVGVIALMPHSNSRGAWQMGLADTGLPETGLKGLYVLLGDEEPDAELQARLKRLEFVVVQASRHTTATAIASVVLPSLAWAEREGTYISMDGHVQQARRAVSPPNGVLSDEDTIRTLARGLGRDLVLTSEIIHG